jgi:hypothetical protein
MYHPVTQEVAVGNRYCEFSWTLLDRGFHIIPAPSQYVQYSSRSIGGIIVGARRVFPNGARG